MRRTLTTLHRWFGLLSAIFLFVAGATGALISWDHELDALLNPRFYHTPTPTPPQDDRAALATADRLERTDPRVMVTWLPLATEPDHTFQLSVDARVDPATGRPYELGFNQVSIDPQSGEVLGKREWGEVSLSRENILPFLYKLHYTMHIPDGFDIQWGMWFMGIVAIVWVLDCFIALYISFPSRKVWRKSLQFRWRAGGPKLNFDLHRSGGVWTWVLLLVISITAVSMNLNRQVMLPLVSFFSTLSPSPFDQPPATTLDKPLTPDVSREHILARARADAAARGWKAPAGGILYSELWNVYGVGFFEADNDHGDGTLGNPYLYYSGKDGSPAGVHIPGEGSGGDLFMQLQFPLHSGRLFGVAGRIIVSLLGLVVAILSVTGVIIWARRKRSRVVSARTGQMADRSGHFAALHAKPQSRTAQQPSSR
ncbi:MAG: PepSY-associated TM helix domain-containing protein [Polyangiales bacterium]